MPLSDVSELSAFFVLVIGVMDTLGAMFMDRPERRLLTGLELEAGTSGSGLSGGVGTFPTPVHRFR